MKLQVKYNYTESYLPSKRHRKLRYRDAEEETIVIINEITKNNAPIAFLVHEILKDSPTEYRLWDNKLWKPIMWHERYSGAEGLYPVEKFIESIHYHSNYKYNKTKEESEKEKHDYVSKHLIIDGVVYGLINEPRYVIITFGLGHNHGGTGMFIENWYNSNISKNSYFNALEREKAITEGKRRAIARGDTKDINRIGTTCNIEVLIPEVVKCNPQEEHGEGDSFLNKLYAITESSSNANEAGLMGLCILAGEMNKE